MEENLRELERLTRAMSREGWEAFRREAGPTGYLFDQFTVVSADDYWAPEIGMAVKRGMIVPPTSDERPAAVTPLLVRGEVIGALGVHDDPQNPLSQGDLALVNLVSEQVAQALESARLFEQTQATLAQTEEMYAASEGVVRATTMDEVLQAVIHSTILQRLAHCTIQLFDHPWGDERPHAMTVVANWERDASSGVPAPAGGGSLIPVGTRHVLAQFPATRWFDREEPRIVRDIATDEYVDENTRALFLDQLGMRSMIILPLVAGEQWIGILSAMGDAVLEVDEAEVRQITSLTGQAAAVIQSLRLLEDAQARVRRERALQEITAAISASGGLDDLMARLSAIVGLLRQLVTVDVLTLATYIPGEPEYTLFALSSIKGSEAAVSEETETGHFAQPGTHLPVEGTGPGWAITHREPWLEEDIRREMPFAEDEQLVAEGVVSRVLLPLLAGEQVVGAFSVGSTQPGAFTREHLPFLRQVADQIALALERARLLEETSAALDEAEATHRAYLRRGLQDYLRQQELLRQGGFLYDRMQDAPGFDGPISPVAGLWRPEMERALTEGRPARASDDGNEEKRTGFAIPIVLRGQTIGVLGVEDPDGETRWSEDDRVVIEAVGQQLALALENARLLDATRQRAEQERIISDVTTRVRASMDLESILQTAVRELGAALGTDRAFIRLGAGARSNDKNDKSQNLNLEGRDE